MSTPCLRCLSSGRYDLIVNPEAQSLIPMRGLRPHSYSLESKINLNSPVVLLLPSFVRSSPPACTPAVALVARPSGGCVLPLPRSRVRRGVVQYSSVTLGPPITMCLPFPCIPRQYVRTSPSLTRTGSTASSPPALSCRRGTPVGLFCPF